MSNKITPALIVNIQLYVYLIFFFIAAEPLPKFPNITVCLDLNVTEEDDPSTSLHVEGSVSFTFQLDNDKYMYTILFPVPIHSHCAVNLRYMYMYIKRATT